MSQFHLQQIFNLVIPCRVQTKCKVGLRCVVCGKAETFTYEEFAKDQEVRKHVMANWTSGQIQGMPAKILCVRCSPSLNTKRTKRELSKHKQAVKSAREDEKRRILCLLN